jgi:hypothetical protein
VSRLKDVCSLRDVVLLTACIATVWVIASTGGVHAVGQAIDQNQVQIRGGKEKKEDLMKESKKRERGQYLCLRLTARLVASVWPVLSAKSAGAGVPSSDS